LIDEYLACKLSCPNSLQDRERSHDESATQRRHPQTIICDSLLSARTCSTRVQPIKICSTITITIKITTTIIKTIIILVMITITIIMMMMMILLIKTTIIVRVPLTMIMKTKMMTNRHQPDAMQVSSLQAGLLSALVMQHHDTHQRCVVMQSSSLLPIGFVWLQRCGSQKGHPDFVGKAAGSAQRSHQQAEAGKRRSDEAIPAIWTPC